MKVLVTDPSLSRKTKLLFESAQDKVRRTMVLTMYSMAQRALDLAQLKLASRHELEFKEYSKSLRIVQASTGSRDKCCFAVEAGPRKVSLSVLNRDTTIVQVVPLRHLDKLSPLSLALVSNGPWPIDMIPCFPKKDTKLVYVKVSRKEVEKLRRDKVQARRDVQSIAQRSGVKIEAFH